jgi:hypothetical protein
MKKIFVLMMTFFFIMGCAGFGTNRGLEERVDELQEQVEMLAAASVGASFRPFSGGLQSGGVGDLDKITGTDDGDVGLVVLQAHTGDTGEGPWDGVVVGNIWGMWVLDDDGGSGDSWPEYGESGDGGNERWEYAGLYSVKTEFLPIGWAIDGTAPPAATETITATNSVKVRKFDGTDGVGDEDVQINWVVPTDYLTGYGKIKFRVLTMPAEGAPSSVGWAFFLQGVSIGDGDLLSSALGTAVESNVDNESNAQYDIVYTATSTVVSIAGLTAGEFVLLKLYRDVSDAEDDYEVDVGVIGIEIIYPAKMTAAW